MQLRTTIKSFNDVEYNFKLVNRLLKGHGLDGDYIRELPALKISGRLEAHQISVGHETMFSDGYDPDAIAKQAEYRIEELKKTLGDMAFEDQVQLAKLGATIVSGGYLQTILIDAASIRAGTIDSARIGAGTITADKIKARSIDTEKITVGGVTSTNLRDGSVVNVKLGSEAVTSGKIATGAIVARHISAGSITADKLAANIILSGTIWAGYNKVRLSSDGIRVYGETLRFYSSDMQLSGYIYGGYRVDEKRTLNLNTDIINLSANDYTHAYQIRVTRLLPNTSDVGYVGMSGNKFAYGYFSNLPGCPTPTSNSGIGVMKRINKPIVREGKHGRRHYFLDEDFPSEMKCRVIKADSRGNPVETEEEEIEYIRTIGVLVQAVRELIEKVDIIEKEVFKNVSRG